MRRAIAAVLLLLPIAACESDEAKLVRLRQEEARAQLRIVDAEDAQRMAMDELGFRGLHRPEGILGSIDVVPGTTRTYDAVCGMSASSRPTPGESPHCVTYRRYLQAGHDIFDARNRLEIIQRDLRVLLALDEPTAPLEVISSEPKTQGPAQSAPVTRPCDGPRPYRDWSNEEISLKLVETMGSDASLPFITEAGCRQP